MGLSSLGRSSMMADLNNLRVQNLICRGVGVETQRLGRERLSLRVKAAVLKPIPDTRKFSVDLISPVFWNKPLKIFRKKVKNDARRIEKEWKIKLYARREAARRDFAVNQ